MYKPPGNIKQYFPSYLEGEKKGEMSQSFYYFYEKVLLFQSL